ncbi:MAG: energy transducer TonB [Chitinophagaceae bacterium]|nr:MAG: energy transducer TonB [Chitinophagaceae bacterium]
MSAHAYSEPYAHNRRHTRASVRTHESQTYPKKSAEIIPLTQRPLKLDKPIDIVYPKYRRLGTSLFATVVVGLHVLVFGYFYYQPIVEAVKKVEVPKIKLERYTPPVIPPQVVQPPKQVKKELPKPVQQKVVTDNPNVVEKYVAPAPVAEGPAQAVEKVTEASATAAYLNNPPPVYPEAAQEKGWEGTVILSVLVQPDGKAKTVEIKTSSGRKILDQAATQTVQRWTFVPARKGETPVEGWVEVPIDFRLGTS